jgi:hypothetical protein
MGRNKFQLLWFKTTTNKNWRYAGSPNRNPIHLGTKPVNACTQNLAEMSNTKFIACDNVKFLLVWKLLGIHSQNPGGRSHYISNWSEQSLCEQWSN